MTGVGSDDGVEAHEVEPAEKPKQDEGEEVKSFFSETWDQSDPVRNFLTTKTRLNMETFILEKLKQHRSNQ